MNKQNIEIGKVASMALGATLLGIIPTIALNWLDVWPHFPALFLAVLGVAAYSSRESPESDFAYKIQAENKSIGLGFLLGALALVLFGSWIADDGSDEVEKQIPREEKQDSQIDSSARTVETDIDELLMVYGRNQIEGYQRFGNSNLEISGTVKRVREALGTGILVLQSPKTGEVMELGYSDRDTHKLGVLRPGDSVVATCPGAMEAMGGVFLSDCSEIEVLD